MGSEVSTSSNGEKKPKKDKDKKHHKDKQRKKDTDAMSNDSRSRTNGRKSEETNQTQSSSDSRRESQNSESGQQIVPYEPDGLSRKWTSRWSDGDDNYQLFSTRRPRDLGAGLSSGLKNACKGVGLGAAALIAAPAIGATQEGVGGFFKGLGAGVVMAVALPVAGVGFGIAQLARGAFNTPEAVREHHAGRKWDKKKREWKENWYSLDSEMEEVESLSVAFELQKKELIESQTEKKVSRARGGNVVDTEYYDTLGVDPGATQAEIRKAYYQAALECHPDKNPDDPTAHQKFQLLGEAYQVLGDEKRRSDYDTQGKSVADNMPIIDSSLFFTMLFGSVAFEPFIGKLKMAMFCEMIENFDSPGQFTEKIMEFEQRKREVVLACELRERLRGYVDGDEKQRDEWLAEMSRMSRDLCQHSFGESMVEAIGWIYENYSAQFLGKLDSFLGLGGKYAKLQAKNREMGNICRVAGSAVKTSIAATKLAKIEQKKEKAKVAQQSKDATKKEQPTTGDDVGQSTSSDSKDATETTSERQMPSAGATESNDNEDNQEENPEYKTASSEEHRSHVEDAKQLQEAMPLILETMLNICLMDIEATIRRAAKKVLKDLATPIETRRQCAEGMLELGKVFQLEAEKYKEEHKNVPTDIMRQVEEAMIRVAQEADRKEDAAAGSPSSSYAD